MAFSSPNLRRVATVRLPALTAAVALLVAGACGHAAKKAVAPKAVPASIVPASIPGDADFPQYTFDEYKEGGERIAKAGSKSVIDDGRVWELRRGQVLVGALQ